MNTINVKFTQKKETPGTFQFAEVLAAGQARGVIGTLYVTKVALEKLGNPTALTVTVAAV